MHQKPRVNHELLTALIALLSVTSQAANNNVPRLVVQIAIDQLRADYIDSYSQQYAEGGLRRLLSQGRVYTNAFYPFSPLDRASAIATLSTGTTPFYNGIVGCQWIDRQSMMPMMCDDGTAERLYCSTLSDELKMRTKGKALVYSIAPYSDAAVMMAGHAADGALWLDQRTGRWSTNAYYPQSTSVMTAYSSQHSLTSSIKGNKVNEEITNMALACIEKTGVGRDNITDFLGITYQAGSDESSYKRLDQQLQRLFTEIENRVKADQIIYIATSTGYADEEALDYAPYRVPTGTFLMERSANLLNMYLSAIYGQGHYVETTFHNEIFLNIKLFDQKRININEALERAQSILLQMSGVRNVYTSAQITKATGAASQSSAGTIDRVKAGYAAERRGDIIIEVAPGWTLKNEDTGEEHTQLFSAIPFPIIIMGADFKAEVVTTPVSTDQIAPTICRNIRIRAPNACQANALP